MESEIFKIRDYSTKKRKYQMVTRDCVICQRPFDVPKHQQNVITTCCNYCQSLALSWKKMKGFYKLCDVCRKPTWVMPNRAKREQLKYYCSINCSNIGFSIYSSERNIGFIQTGNKKYYGGNWLTQRRRARERDGFRCQECGIDEREYGQELSVHHIKPFVYFETYEDANHLDNLLSLCEPCHRKIHSGENHHYKFDVEQIKFKDERYTVVNQQKAKAMEVLHLLFNTDKSLREVSNVTGMSYSKVQKIYRGGSWKELYDKSPREVRPRVKNIKHAQRVYKYLVTTKLTLTDISRKVGCSLAMVQDIYKGRTWGELYEVPPYLTNPRMKAWEIEVNKII
jgi:5-methylcytosine-specific restriction endonuclease McrA